MSLAFGTDGVRGDAATELTSDLVQALGTAAADVLGADREFVIGRDPRESGPRVVEDLRVGLASRGVEVVDLGVAPTPLVAYWSAVEDAPAAMVSASHNPWTDNGVKLFGSGGKKLDDHTQRAIEDGVRTAIASSGDRRAPSPAPSPSPDRVSEIRTAYGDHVLATLDSRRLDGMRVVLDCANGAASDVAPRIFRQVGAQVVSLHATPDGRNINEQCGSTDPRSLQAAVSAGGADLGLAFDGDADRVIAVDEHGQLVDGDQMIVMTAIDLHDRNQLTNGGVVVTVMSNLGLRRALVDAGITVVTTPVGDRQVLAALHDHGLILGGEQSGHIVFGQRATTGDGLLTGLTIVDLMKRRGEPLSRLAAAMRRYPQVLENVRVSTRVDLEDATEVWAAVDAEAKALGDDGRVLVRSSGTEPVVRVMVEADERGRADAVAARLAEVVRSWSAGASSGS